MQEAPDRLILAVHTRRELDDALDRTVTFLMPAAITERVGILVTRLALMKFV